MKREEKPGSLDPANTISSKEIEELATVSLQKANTAISAIECAVAAWESSKQKPVELKQRMERLMEVYGVFSDWERKMLRAMSARKQNQDSKIALLGQFSDIAIRYG